MTNADLSLLKDLLSCHEATIARLRLSGGLCEWLHTVAATANALRSAIATIESLPVTKDGVRVVPHTVELYHPDDPQELLTVWWRDDHESTSKSGVWYVQDEHTYNVGGLEHLARLVSECSIREAARDGQGG